MPQTSLNSPLRAFDVLTAHVVKLRVYAADADAAALHVIKGGPAGIVSEALSPQILEVHELPPERTISTLVRGLHWR